MNCLNFIIELNVLNYYYNLQVYKYFDFIRTILNYTNELKSMKTIMYKIIH